MSFADRDRELRTGDEAARALARRSFDRPMLLEAGAGTGKTTTLIARLVAWMLGPGWERATVELASQDVDRIARTVLDGVVAITFTEAAAADMEKKLGAAFASLARGARPLGVFPDDLPPDANVSADRAAALARGLDRPVVHTIHAFCRGLLAEHPFEAGLSPSFEVDADGSAVDRIAREVLEAELGERLAGKPDASIARLLTGDAGPERLREALTRLVASGRRASDLEFDPYTPERATRLVASLSREITSFLHGPAASLRAAGARAPVTRATLDELAAVHELLPQGSSVSIDVLDAAAERLREQWSPGSRKRLGQWAKAEFNTAESKCVGEHATAVAAGAAALARALDAFRRMRPLQNDSARTTLARLLERVRSELLSRGVETYADLLRDARDLVEEHPHVVARLRSRMRQLVVDEFQDTDPVQCDILRRIALDGVPGTTKPGLFLVGDPKQSIYGWRSADLESYEAFAKELEAEHAGVRARLSVNHRSTRRILADVERVMSPILEARPGVQPEFQPLVASRDDEGEPPQRLVPWGLDAAPGSAFGPRSKSRAREIEADWIADDLARNHAQESRWQDSAILLRATGDLEIYLAALREHGIPYEVAGDKSYYQRREIVEASVLVRTIADPRDHVALVALLRSSLVGAPDAALVPLWRHGFHEHATEIEKPGDAGHAAALRAVAAALPEVPRDVPGIERITGFGASLVDAVNAIAHLRASLSQDPADVFVEELRTRFLVEARAARLYSGAYRVSNLERFFERLATELDVAGNGTQSCLRALRAAVNERREAEEARPKDGALDAVQVLTIHKSKGLDFRHVYVVDMDRETPASRVPNCDLACVDGRTSYAFFGSATPGYEEVEAARERVAAAERVRTLYVAMTRAKDRLVLCLPLPAAIRTTPWEQCGTHLELVLASTPAGVPEELHAAYAGGDRTRAIGEGSWILPDRSPASAVGARRARAEDGEIEIPHEVLALPAIRAIARERMLRPWSSTATARAASGAVERPKAGFGADREASAALGRAFHRWLESTAALEPAGSPDESRAALLGHLERDLGAAPPPEGIARAMRLFDRFHGGALHAQLRALASCVLARELPVLLPPSGDDAATGFVSGAIDLVYRDPSNGEIVIADYKTDVTPTDDSSARYTAQGRAYRRAVREALGLERDPRFELWYVAQDRIEVVD